MRNTFDIQFRFGHWLVVEYEGITCREICQHRVYGDDDTRGTQADAEKLFAALIQDVGR